MYIQRQKGTAKDKKVQPKVKRYSQRQNGTAKGKKVVFGCTFLSLAVPFCLWLYLFVFGCTFSASDYHLVSSNIS
jgi:hypothetical protein